MMYEGCVLLVLLWTDLLY